MSLNSGLRILETEIMAVKSFVIDQLFIIKQSAKKNTGHLLSTPSGNDDNSVLKTPIEIIKLSTQKKNYHTKITLYPVY